MRPGENENQNVHLLFFTWHLLSNALQMTVCFSMAFFICLFIRPSVRTYHITPELCALCAMLSNVCTPTACVLVYFCYVVCNYRSQINQYKANNRIVYIIYLSGMIQQVHLCALHTHRIITVTGYGYRYYFTFPNAKRSAATFTLFVSSPLLFVLGAKRFWSWKLMWCKKSCGYCNRMAIFFLSIEIIMKFLSFVYLFIHRFSFGLFLLHLPSPHSIRPWIRYIQ